MANNLSKTQIDKLGDRLRKGDITEADLRSLDEYRRSFSESYEFVVGAIRSELALAPTGRPAKSTTSISEKLERESIRLTQMQDIAGCRLVVANIMEQRLVVEGLRRVFDDATVVDRREKPSHGYRAIHVIVKHLDKLVEVQVRTSLQHVWAELSEKYSDVIDPGIKYGRGHERIVQLLARTSQVIAEEERLEIKVDDVEKSISIAIAEESYPMERQDEVIALQADIRRLREQQAGNREESVKKLRDVMNQLQNEGDADVISN